MPFIQWSATKPVNLVIYLASKRRGLFLVVTDSKGFTLLELMIVIVILGITMAVAAPSLSTMMANNRLSSNSSDFAAALQLAKAEAVARLNSVIVCKKNTASTACVTTGDWSQGWIVFSDDNGDGGVNAPGEVVLLVHDALNSGISFGGTSEVDSSITFRPSGTSNVTTTGELIICNDNVFDSNARGILVTITGRGSVMKASDTGQISCI
jgi:type IV fimbrial biogenesis protein FimT